jgi:hypothetical protein
MCKNEVKITGFYYYKYNSILKWELGCLSILGWLSSYLIILYFISISLCPYFYIL